MQEQREVDAWLDRIEPRLREANGPDPLLADEIRRTQFGMVKRGYRTFAVDQWLKELATIADVGPSESH